MKLEILEVEGCEETTVTIHCNSMDDTVIKLVAAIRSADKRIAGTKDANLYLFEPHEIFYFESVDKHTFLYTANGVYETPLRLYEIEEKKIGSDFFRANKSTILNLSKVKMLNPVMGGRIEVLLENNERQVVSRQYVPTLKAMLDL